MITLIGNSSFGSTPIAFNRSVYSGGEVSVRLTSNLSYESLSMTAEIRNSEDFMELVMLTDAIRRNHPKMPIYLTIPYFPYARQDRVCNSGEALGARVFADLINSLKFEHVTVWDAHSDVVGAVLDRCYIVHCENFVRWIDGVNKMTLVAPDAGAAKKVKQCADLVGTKYVTAHKVRDPKTGNITGTGLDTDAKFPGDVLMVDDICDGGRTFIELARVIRKQMKKGAKLHLYVTHGIFSKGLGVLRDAGIDNVFCPNVWKENVQFSTHQPPILGRIRFYETTPRKPD